MTHIIRKHGKNGPITNSKSSLIHLLIRQIFKKLPNLMCHLYVVQFHTHIICVFIEMFLYIGSDFRSV